MAVKEIKSTIKIILSILFLICLFHLPYGYYELVRFFGLAGFSLLAYYAFKEKKELEVIIYILLAILFQPLFKIGLGRTLWNIVDIAVAIGLLFSIKKWKK
jgi:hypothetical protein